MMKYLLFQGVMALALTSYAQQDVAGELEKLDANQQYEKIVKQYGSKTKHLDGKSLYYVGNAFYMLGRDEDAIKLLKQSIEKDPSSPAPHFTLASSLNYSGKYNEAIAEFREALKLEDNSLFYSGIGDAYFMMEKPDSALANYQTATKKPNCMERPYMMIPQIYLDKSDTLKAIEGYYIAKANVNPGSEEYIRALFNIGLIEYLRGNYDNAEKAYIEITGKNNTDYQVYSKLIQVYYAKGEPEKAKPWRELLYEANRKKLLPMEIADRFCFDQFRWNGLDVLVYERYQEGDSDNIYYKYIFFVLNKEHESLGTVQTEYSPFSKELGGPKYLMCAEVKTTHHNPGIGFNDDASYEDLKKAAIWMFDKYIKE